jgi:putative aldouronate transport system substrate-binding protein
MNLAVLKDAGYPVVKTINQYGTLIKEYIQKNPTYDGAENIGFSIPTEGSRVSALQYGGARFLGGYPNDGPTYVDQETLVAKLNMRAPFTKDYRLHGQGSLHAEGRPVSGQNQLRPPVGFL